MEDVVTARPGTPVSIQLGSAVTDSSQQHSVQARHMGLTGAPRKRGRDWPTLRGDKLHAVRASHCVLACYNMMIPYLCPELPEKQKQALRYGVKEPLIYTHVALRNWKAVREAGHSPNCFSGKLPFAYGAGFSGEHWRVSISEDAGRAHGVVHAARRANLVGSARINTAWDAWSC